MKRRAIVYTLPPIVLIAAVVVISMAAWKRSHMLAELAHTLAHGEQAEAESAARQLAVVSAPPIALLVDVAASEDRMRAQAAQVALGRILDRVEKDADAGQQLSRASKLTAELSSTLAEHRRAFPRGSHPWLADTTQRILKIANQCPAKMPLIGLHCDDIISVISLTRPRAPVALPAVASMTAIPAPDLQLAGLEREFASFAAEAKMPAKKTISPISTASDPSPEPEGAADASRLPIDSTHSLSASPANVAAEVRPDWSNAEPRMLPANTVRSLNEVRTDEEAVVPSKQATNSKQPLDDARDLLERWRTSRSERPEIEDELATRGFRPIPKRLVEQYFSENLADRLRLVDSVLTEPGVDARPWLILLAEDENAEVRLMAVTVMATSDDKALVEKAWQTALRDRDSRIADLAARLRQRREGPTRR